MKESKLDEIKKKLETLIDFHEGTGALSFGKHEGTFVHLMYDGDYSNIWIGKLNKEAKIDISMTIFDCRVEIEESKIRFYMQDGTITIGG